MARYRDTPGYQGYGEILCQHRIQVEYSRRDIREQYTPGEGYYRQTTTIQIQRRATALSTLLTRAHCVLPREDWVQDSFHRNERKWKRNSSQRVAFHQKWERNSFHRPSGYPFSVCGSYRARCVPSSVQTVTDGTKLHEQ